MNPRVLAIALATFFAAIQFYTSLEALSQTPQFGYAFVGKTGAAALAAVIVSSALVCAYALVRARVAIRRSVFFTIVAAWLGVTVASALLGLDPLYGLEVAAMMALASCFGCALVAWYREPGVARTVAGVYLAIGGLASLAGIAMVLARVPRALYASSFGRAAGFFVTANQFAEFAEFFAFVALGLALGARAPRIRMLASGCAAIGFAALALTFSRECYLGAAVAAVFFAFVTGRRAIAAGLAGVTLAAALAIAFHPLPHHDPSDSFSRLRTLQAGLRVAELFPLTGAGPAAYARVYPAIAPVNGAPPGTFGALHPHDAYVSLAGRTRTARAGRRDLRLGALRTCDRGDASRAPRKRAHRRARRVLGARGGFRLGTFRYDRRRADDVRVDPVCGVRARIRRCGSRGMKRRRWIARTALVLACGCSRGIVVMHPVVKASASAKPHAKATVIPIAVVGSGHGGDPFRMTQLRHGQVRYTLIADALRGHYAGADTGTSQLVNPDITFLATGGKRLVAVAPAGTVVEKDKTVLMNGGVHARSQDGMTLASDSLRYDDQSEIVHGQGHVVVTFKSGERLTGDTVDWNLRTGDIEMNTGSK